MRRAQLDAGTEVAAVANLPFRGPGGRLWKTDAGRKDVSLALEVDSKRRHGGPDTHQAEIDKFNDIQDAGWYLVRITPEHTASGPPRQFSVYGARSFGLREKVPDSVPYAGRTSQTSRIAAAGSVSRVIIRKSGDEIAKMREAGKVVSLVLREVQAASGPGVTTLDLDRVAADIIRDNDCKPSFLHYRGTFPAVICTSPNDAIVHGIPGNYRLKDGDILSVDAGAIYEGYQADAAVTYPIGEIPETTATLLRVTEAALHAGIAQAVHGNRLSDISHAVELVARPYGYGIVREYVGHGIGQLMHEDPQIPNYGPPGKGPRIKEGMCFAIEPMFNVGSWETRSMPDGWTVRTRDGSLSAHFEHTVAVTDTGPEILTLP